MNKDRLRLTGDTMTTANPYVEGFLEKFADLSVKKAFEPSTMMNFGPEDPYQLGMQAKRTGDSYMASALVNGMLPSGLHGMGEGAVIGGVLGHPLSRWVTSAGRAASKAGFIDDARKFEDFMRRLSGISAQHGIQSVPGHAWGIIKNMVTGKPHAVDQALAFKKTLGLIGQDMGKSDIMTAMRPVFARHGKGAVIGSLGVGALMAGLRGGSNLAQYGAGHALTPAPVTPVGQAWERAKAMFKNSAVKQAAKAQSTTPLSPSTQLTPTTSNSIFAPGSKDNPRAQPGIPQAPSATGSPDFGLRRAMQFVGNKK